MWKLNFKGSLAAAFILLTGMTTPAWALDWHDPEWSGLGCPSKLSGEWTPLTDSSYTGSKIEFKSKSATLISKENNSVFFIFPPNSKDGQYLHLKQISGDLTSFPEYLKIRPHIAVQSISEGKKYTLCKIKVFLFESKQKADQMSYLRWDIYSTIDSLEVPNGN